MATKLKKNSTYAASKNKYTSLKAKAMTKKTYKKKKRKNNNTSKKIILLLIFILLSLLATGLIYSIGKNKNTEFPYHTEEDEAYSTEELLKDLAQIKVKKPKISEQNEKSAVVKNVLKENKKGLPLKERGEKNLEKIKSKKQKKENTTLAYRGKKPKLVIVIDDVHTKAQLNTIKKLEMKITPSIFPPYKLAKHSNLLAKQIEHFMIHLPMESGNKQLNTQYKTLKISFSKNQIIARVKEIRRLFPNATYINNHTGSVFTSDYNAMKILYGALKAEGFTFIDSFTVSTSKVKKIVHEFGDAYVRRDVFIDNKHNVEYIHNQLKIAVKKAKKNGYAIAIGHPHKATLEALASAKGILAGVQLVYIDSIYKRK